jgi:uncharacterized protein (UPF0332 family)
VKEMNHDIEIIGKSHYLSSGLNNKYTSGSIKVFDRFFSTKTSLIGTSKKYGNDLNKKFKLRKVASSINKMQKSSNDIISFGSSLTGRINSR